MSNQSDVRNQHCAGKRVLFLYTDRFKREIDRLIYVVVILCPIMNLPQLLKIWILKDASGVSLISWVSFSVFSFAWLVYGISHKDKPIVFMNFALMIMQVFIAVGTFLYG